MLKPCIFAEVMATLQDDLVNAGSVVRGERLGRMALFLQQNGFYDIQDMVSARNVELVLGSDDLCT